MHTTTLTPHPQGTGKKKPKYQYKTVEELKAKSHEYQGEPASSKGGAGSSVKVIDMTGPQKRVLTGYDEIHNRHTHPDETTASKQLSE